MIVNRKQLAEHLGVSLDTIRTWQRHRLIPFFKVKNVVRFNLERVEKALQKFEREEAK